jgi:translation initiation factor 2B subunit (eIF-2B alpha/beta/delta family)
MQQTETKEQLRAKLKNALDELVETQEQNSTLYEVIRVLTGRIQHLEKLAENELHTFANS